MSTKFKILLTFFIFSLQHAFSQNIVINKIEQADLLLEKKLKVNNSFSIYTNYSLQIASTQREEAEKIYNQFVKDFPNEDATIIYSQPHYKVLVGNYRNKIEAAHLQEKIKDKFPNSFVVRLKK